MTLQLHRPDGEGGLEPAPPADADWRTQLQSPRWGTSLEGDRLPRLSNPEMNPTSRFRSVLFWLGLGVRDVPRSSCIGYGTGFWTPAAGLSRPSASRDPGATSPILHRPCDSFPKFVDSNDREIRRLQPLVDETNALEAEYEALSDEEIRAAFDELRAEVLEAAAPDEPSEDELHHPDLERRRELTKDRRKRENERLQKALDDVLPEVFAMTREAMKRTLGMRHFDVQLMGAAVLHQGKIAEMRTGEGKTLVAPLAAILNSLSGRGVHVVTVNDYLARRDPQWMGPIFHFLGVSVGMITHDASFVFEPDYPTTDERLLNLRPVTPARGVRGGHHVRHEQRVRVRLPARQHGPRARPAGPARAQLRDRRRGRQHPHRRGADAADHQRPGRGVGRPVLHVRPARAAPQGAPRGRRGGRRLLRRPQGQGRLLDRGRHREDGGLARRREHVRRRPAAGPPLRAGAAGPRPVQARPRLHRQGRRDRHRRRVHRPPDARPALERGPAPGDRGQGRPARPARERDPRHDHVPELLPAVRQAVRDDRHGDDRGRGVPQDLQARGRGHPDPPRDDPRGLRRPRVPRRAGQVQRPDRRDRRDAGGRPAGPRRHDQRREVRDAGHDAQAARHQARGPQRQVPREGVGHRRPGRPGRRGDDRHQHGRPRHGHPARRQPGRPRLRGAPQARPQPGRGGQGDVRRGAGRGQGHHRARTTTGSSRPAACTSSAPSGTTRAGSTTSCAAVPVARAIPARRASTCRSRTTS